MATERQMWAVLTAPHLPSEVVAVAGIIGPFKTKAQARKCAQQYDDAIVSPLTPWYDSKEQRISLYFDQFLDPTRRDKK